MLEINRERLWKRLQYVGGIGADPAGNQQVCMDTGLQGGMPGAYGLDEGSWTDRAYGHGG